jgi:hypothetical protein
VTGQRYILFISPLRDNPDPPGYQSTGFAQNSHPSDRFFANYGHNAFSGFTVPWSAHSGYELAFKATFLPGAQSPGVTTGPASRVLDHSATLNGSVNPNGDAVTDCHFEYGLTHSYGATAPCTPPPGAGTNQLEVTAPATGLKGHRLYHYRLVATNSSANTSDGADRTFMTPPSAPPGTHITKASIDKSNHRATFRFRSEGGGGLIRFECKLDHGHFRPCRSPSTYRHLKPGKHTFAVRARNEAGTDPTSAHKTFRIPKPHR